MAGQVGTTPISDGPGRIEMVLAVGGSNQIETVLKVAKEERTIALVEHYSTLNQLQVQMLTQTVEIQQREIEEMKKREETQRKELEEMKKREAKNEAETQQMKATIAAMLKFLPDMTSPP